MTVYYRNSSHNLSAVFYINLLLILVCIAVLTAHVIISNRLTQEKLALDEAQKIAHSISVEVATDEAKIERRQEIGKLISLARDRGMVESKNGQTLFINENVAFIPE